MERDYSDTVILANCLLNAAPAADASDARRKNRSFHAFLDSMDWKKFEEKSELRQQPKTAENTLKQLFGGSGLNVPFRDRQKKKGD